MYFNLYVQFDVLRTVFFNSSDSQRLFFTEPFSILSLRLSSIYTNPCDDLGSSFPLNLSLSDSFFAPSWTLAPFFPLPDLDLPFSSSQTLPGSCHLSIIPFQTLSPPPFFEDYLSFSPSRDTDLNSNLFSF